MVAAAAGDGGGALPVYAFMGGLALATTFYGGTYAVLPAYLANLFGTRDVGAIHGRALTAASVATFAGPGLNNFLRQRSYDEAAESLSAQIDPAVFEQTFGASVDKLPMLMKVTGPTLPP